MKRQYWLDKFEGKCKSGIWFRAKALMDFIRLVEEKEGKVVAINFDVKENILELVRSGDKTWDKNEE